VVGLGSNSAAAKAEFREVGSEILTVHLLSTLLRPIAMPETVSNYATFCKYIRFRHIRITSGEQMS